MNQAEKLADSLTTRQIYLERVKASVRNDVFSILRELERELTHELENRSPVDVGGTTRQQERLKTLLSNVRETISTSYLDAKDALSVGLKEVAKLESQFIIEAANRSVGVDIMQIRLSPQTLNSIARNTLFEGAPSKNWWSRQERSLLDSFARKVREGMLRGRTTPEIVQSVRGTKAKNYTDGIMNTSRKQAEVLVRTSVQTVSNEARIETYRENSDVVRGIQWVSTLDNRTSPICIALDGLMWDAETLKPIKHDKEFPGPTAHWGAVLEGCQIETNFGRMPVEAVRCGVQVLTHAGRFRRVTATMRKSVKADVVRVFELKSGGVLRVTNEHPVLVRGRGWIRADAVRVGDQFFQHITKSKPVGVLPVGITATKDYPSAFDEEPVFPPESVTVAKVECSEFDRNPPLRQRYVDHVAINDMLVNERNRVCVENVHNSDFGFWHHLALLPLNGSCNGVAGLLKADGVLRDHPCGMRKMHLAGLLRHSESPMILPARVFSELPSGYLRLFDPCADGDAMLFNPEGESSGTDSVLALNQADGLSVFPMFNGYKCLYGGCVSQVHKPERWYTSAVQSIAEVRYTGDVLNLAVEEDETYVADSVIVHNCRSTQVSVLKPWKKLEEGKAITTDKGGKTNAQALFEKHARELGLSPDAASKSLFQARASMDGEVAGDTTFGSWLKRRSNTQQDKILGPQVAQLFRDGKISARQLTDQNNRPLSLAELAALK